jgi:hypothetical protein
MTFIWRKGDINNSTAILLIPESKIPFKCLKGIQSFLLRLELA